MIVTLMKCERCHLDVREYEWHCPNCLQDLGVPNVRVASFPAETDALAQRYQHALAALALAGTAHLAGQYESALSHSLVVVCRSYLDVLELLQSDDQIYSTSYQQVEAETRRPGGNHLDRDRRTADAIFFPYYEREIRFGALSLDGLGLDHYGPVSIVLRPEAIQHRCSFFHSNTLAFAADNRLGPGRPIPPGFRSDWQARGRLAVAKGAEHISPDTIPEDFPQILLIPEDFIEAHVFGPIHRRGIAALILVKPNSPADMAYMHAIQDTITRDGLQITIEIL